VNSVTLLDDGTDTTGTRNRPGEESDSSNGNYVSLDGEEMSDLVDREPESRKRAKPEDEEGSKVRSVCARIRTESVGDVFPRLPDRSDHEIDTVSTNVSLNSIPDTSYSVLAMHCIIGENRYIPIAARFRTGHRPPQIPKALLLITGKLMW
jgi:hypothetical protein